MKRTTFDSEQSVTESSLKKKKGLAFGLDLLLAVAAIAVVLYLVVNNANKAGQKMDIANSSSQLSQMVNGTQNLYLRASDFSTVTAQVLLDNHQVPEDMNIGGTSIIHQWNDSVTVAPATRVGANDSIAFTYNSVPSDACSDFVGAVNSNFWRVNVAGTDVKNTTVAGLVKINPATLGTACKSSDLVDIVFTAGRN